MPNWEWISFIAAGFELTAIYLLGNKKLIAFPLFVCGSLCWITYSLLSNSAHGLLFVCSCSTILNIRALVKWGRKHEANS